MYNGPIANLVELKARIMQQLYNAILETLRSVVKHAVHRFQLMTDNGGQQKNLSDTRLAIIKSLIIMYMLCGFWLKQGPR